jgi:ATP-dependent exoDNAse (exonuclease V) beta subunit
LYPPADRRRTAKRGEKCPVFRSKDTVLERPDNEMATPATVCPGHHEFDGYSVVWWDPSALTLGLKAANGLRRDDLIVRDVARDVVADGRTKYDVWKLARISAREQGSVPTVRVQTVREYITDVSTLAAESNQAPGTQASAGPPVAVTIVSLSQRDHDRPSGAAFGTLVHAVLARAPFDASPAALDDIVALEARVLAMGEEETAAASAIVERVLKHDLLVRAKRADARGACRRETPVTLTLGDGTLVEGVVDLAFEEDGVWTIVEYKTDREIAASEEEQYRRQLGAYASAVARATGQPASGILVRI